MMITACNSAMSTIINLIIGAIVGMLGGYIRYLIKKQKDNEDIENITLSFLKKLIYYLLGSVIKAEKVIKFVLLFSSKSSMIT